MATQKKSATPTDRSARHLRSLGRTAPFNKLGLDAQERNRQLFIVDPLFMKNGIDWIDRTLYPSSPAESWDVALFRQIVLDHLESSHVLLDVGAGAGIQHLMDFKEHAKFVYGFDPDPRVASNPFLHDGRIASAERIPWPDNTFDLVISNNVLEHLSNPEQVFREIYRVLKPSGMFLFKTPNKWVKVPN